MKDITDWLIQWSRARGSPLKPIATILSEVDAMAVHLASMPDWAKCTGQSDFKDIRPDVIHLCIPSAHYKSVEFTFRKTPDQLEQIPWRSSLAQQVITVFLVEAASKNADMSKFIGWPSSMGSFVGELSIRSSERSRFNISRICKELAPEREIPEINALEESQVWRGVHRTPLGAVLWWLYVRRWFRASWVARVSRISHNTDAPLWTLLHYNIGRAGSDLLLHSGIGRQRHLTEDKTPMCLFGRGPEKNMTTKMLRNAYTWHHLKGSGPDGATNLLRLGLENVPSLRQYAGN